MRTIERVTEPAGSNGALWRCGKCGWSGTPHELYQHQTSLLLSLVGTPDCPPAIRRLLDHCGWLLHLVSQGDETALAESASAARQAVRVLHLFGEWEPWFSDAN